MLRPRGAPAARERVIAALANGHSCWCLLVQLEQRNGARGREGTEGQDVSNALPELAMDDSVWTEAFDLARRARARGVTVPAADIAIAACARRHGAVLATADRDVALPASIDT